MKQLSVQQQDNVLSIWGRGGTKEQWAHLEVHDEPNMGEYFPVAGTATCLCYQVLAVLVLAFNFISLYFRSFLYKIYKPPRLPEMAYKVQKDKTSASALQI